MWQRETLEISTTARGFSRIDRQIHRLFPDWPAVGSVHVFLQHTSASLVMTENADPDVLVDLQTWANHVAPEGDDMFRHRAEGPDDMPAHVRNAMIGCQITLPADVDGLVLGTWQGLYVWEHRAQAHNRRLVVTLQAE